MHSVYPRLRSLCADLVPWQVLVNSGLGKVWIQTKRQHKKNGINPVDPPFSGNDPGWTFLKKVWSHRGSIARQAYSSRYREKADVFGADPDLFPILNIP